MYSWLSNIEVIYNILSFSFFALSSTYMYQYYSREYGEVYEEYEEG